MSDVTRAPRKIKSRLVEPHESLGWLIFISLLIDVERLETSPNDSIGIKKWLYCVMKAASSERHSITHKINHFFLVFCFLTTFLSQNSIATVEYGQIIESSMQTNQKHDILATEIVTWFLSGSDFSFAGDGK